MAPLDFASSAGTLGHALIFGAIGFSFGAVLEMAGFGDTRKLAAQFYFRDLTVLRVMFTAIVVAAVLVGLATGFGLLDMNRVWVNPTFLWPEILGGVVMGVGFVIGGFCPGTSVVAAATLKIDGMFFVLGALIGVFAFGESVGSYEPFFLSSNMGRFTLPEWLGLPLGVVVLLIVVMALGMFAGADALEKRFGDPSLAVPRVSRRVQLGGAAGLLLAGVVLAIHGQPSLEQKWAKAAPALQKEVADKAMFVSPAEVVSLRKDNSVRVSVIDLRDEHDYNLFHIGGARRLPPGEVLSERAIKELLNQPPTTVTFLVGNGEDKALAAWKALRAAGAQNLYIVEGGYNRWLDLYPVPACVAEPHKAGDAESLGPRFSYATGARLPAAWPELPTSRDFRAPCEPPRAEHTPAGHGNDHGHGTVWPDHPFVKRVKLQTRSVVKGGCG